MSASESNLTPNQPSNTQENNQNDELCENQTSESALESFPNESVSDNYTETNNCQRRATNPALKNERSVGQLATLNTNADALVVGSILREQIDVNTNLHAKLWDLEKANAELHAEMAKKDKTLDEVQKELQWTKTLCVKLDCRLNSDIHFLKKQLDESDKRIEELLTQVHKEDKDRCQQIQIHSTWRQKVSKRLAEGQRNIEKLVMEYKKRQYGRETIKRRERLSLSQGDTFVDEMHAQSMQRVLDRLTT